MSALGLRALHFGGSLASVLAFFGGIAMLLLAFVNA